MLVIWPSRIFTEVGQNPSPLVHTGLRVVWTAVSLGLLSLRGSRGSTAQARRARNCQMSCVASTASVMPATPSTGSSVAQRTPTAPTARPVISAPTGVPPHRGERERRHHA